MYSPKRLSFTLLLALFSFGTAYAQTPLVLAEAELAIPFGSAKGQMAFVGSHLVFVAQENPRSSLTITQAEIATIQRSGEVVTITTRRALRDADGERDTFRFRLSQPGALMSWYETASAAALTAAAGPVDTPKAAGASAVISSYQVKHDHAIGSCHGTLILTEDGVIFESNDKIEDSRQWKLIDIRKVGQDGVYKLKIETFRGGDFNFELSGKGIDSGEYRRLVDRIARARTIK